MKNLFINLIAFLSFYSTCFSQSSSIEIITHKVELGETMVMISKKYLVDPAEIYKLNEQAINGVSEGMLLKIPQSIESKELILSKKELKEKEKMASLEQKREKQQETIVQNEEFLKRVDIKNLNIDEGKKYIDYIVTSGETLNSLSKKFSISIEELTNDNKDLLKKGLQAGQKLKILVTNKISLDEETQIISSVNSETTSELKEISHKVLEGETLYSISKKYGISIDDIQKSNQDILKKGLKSGQNLHLKITNDSDKISIKGVDSFSKDEIDTKLIKTLKHKVEKKETLYSISKKYGVSVDQIISDNPSLKYNELKADQELHIKIVEK